MVSSLTSHLVIIATITIKKVAFLCGRSGSRFIQYPRRLVGLMRVSRTQSVHVGTFWVDDLLIFDLSQYALVVITVGCSGD